MQHPHISGQYRVGCICAEKMSDDYVEPKIREGLLKSYTQKRSRWMNRKWLTSRKGNLYLKIKGQGLEFDTFNDDEEDV